MSAKVTLNQERVNELFSVYQECLTEAVNKKPQDYRYGVEDVPEIVERFKSRVVSDGSINNIGIQSNGFRAACKRLGIKCTYQGINEFLQS